jgi:GTP pyrophosphokinase
VEILTSRQPSPSRDWLNPQLGYLKTAKARAKVRAWFKLQDFDKNVAAGRASLDRELHRLSVTDLAFDTLAQRFRYERLDDFLAALGRGDVTTAQVAGALQDVLKPEAREHEPAPLRLVPDKGAPGEVRILGVGNLLTTMARCCKPVPGDPVIGYITRGRGVSVHRRDCANVLRLSDENRARLVEVEWSAEGRETYPVDIEVEAYDRHGLLRDVTSILADAKLNVIAVNTVTDKHDHMAHMRLTLEIADIGQLSQVLNRIAQLPNVTEARRTRGG